jgi:hypothetical protein
MRIDLHEVVRLVNELELDLPVPTCSSFVEPDPYQYANTPGCVEIYATVYRYTVCLAALALQNGYWS